MDNESIIRICVSAFSEEDISEAKTLLFTSTKTSKKCISRRKDRKQKDLEDIITVFKTIDPDQLPLFVAYELHKLPPVTFDHVDVTKLLKDILVLQSEIATLQSVTSDIKNNYVTKEHLKNVSEEIINPFFHSNVNKIRGGGYGFDSGPVGLQPVQSADHGGVHDVTVEESSQYTSPVRTHLDPGSCSNPVLVALTNSNMTATNVTDNKSSPQKLPVSQNKPTLAQIVNNGPKNDTEDGWSLVQKKKIKKRFESKSGKACSDISEKFKASDIKIPLFISNVNKETTENDICEYVTKMTGETLTVFVACVTKWTCSPCRKPGSCPTTYHTWEPSTMTSRTQGNQQWIPQTESSLEDHTGV
ncbi:uncharacterized protein LOC121725477 [Aricia agestis]|uniref:uncharacterized protein LOC121725477 n=1 Tax=Aricia agestis TaxID=91739 RepID=UPI001C201B5B|nr:uncharacterized protein LOC121725477 [Aricia agestis]